MYEYSFAFLFRNFGYGFKNCNIFKTFKFIEMTNIKKIILKQNLLIHNNYRNKIYNKYKKNKF